MTITQDQRLMTLLKVTEIRHLIAHTSLGELTIMIRKGEKEYTLCLDAVPLKSSLDAYDVKEVMDILFPVKKIEIPQVIRPNIIASAEALKAEEVFPIVAEKKLNAKKPNKSEKK